MPAVQPTPRVKLRSASRRVPRARSTEADSSAVPAAEPNMRLSRAIMVMLLLHVVAVGGILAFSMIKERGQRRTPVDPASAAVEAEDSNIPSTKTEDVESNRGKGGPHPGTHIVQPGETLTRIANDNGTTVAALRAVNGGDTLTATPPPGLKLTLPDKPPGETPAPGTNAADTAEHVESGRTAPTGSTPGDKNNHLPQDSGKTYIVGKGESPYTIAQKLKVSYDALLKLNQIDDPKKLKPGQKLRVPAVVKTKVK